MVQLNKRGYNILKTISRLYDMVPLRYLKRSKITLRDSF